MKSFVDSLEKSEVEMNEQALLLTEKDADAYGGSGSGSNSWCYNSSGCSGTTNTTVCYNG